MKKTTLSLLMTLSLFPFLHAYAQSGHTSGGNGGLDPTNAYSRDDLNKVNSNFNLDYLKLTPGEIQKRDEELKPIYQFYQNVTVSKVVQKLEETYGLNIYSYSNLHYPTLADKKNVMSSAVCYFSHAEARYGRATRSLLSDTPFEHIDSDVLPGKQSITLSSELLHHLKISGGKDYGAEGNYESAFLLSTLAESQSIEHDWFGVGIIDFNTHKHALYTSTNVHLFELPIVDRFFAAMKDSNLKALDATIVFGNLKEEPYHVIYPAYSHLAPIPQPIVYISAKASKEDISEMLEKHAPQIYAYNQLFMKQILPSADDLNQALRKYPALLASVAKDKKEVDRQRVKDALNAAFLYVSYGIMTGAIAGVAAPVALVAALASPVLAPIIIANTVVIVQ